MSRTISRSALVVKLYPRSSRICRAERSSACHERSGACHGRILAMTDAPFDVVTLGTASEIGYLHATVDPDCTNREAVAHADRNLAGCHMYSGKCSTVQTEINPALPS